MFDMPRKLRAVALGAALSALAAGVTLADGSHSHEPIGEAVNELPLFDAHIHYKEPAWSQFSTADIIELMDKNGVAMGLVSSTPDEGTIMLWKYAPNRIVPEVRPYHDDVDSGNWAKAPDIEGYLAERLAAYPHVGIGEFHIHKLDTRDEGLFLQIIKMAKAGGLWLHVHSGAGPVRWLYSLDADVKIIWAHAGLSTSADDVYALMEEFPNLYADTSLRENNILAPGKRLNPKWEKVIFAFQDRLMIGSDTWINEQWESYSEIMQSNRRWLSYLPRDVAEKIAYQNAERIFGRKVSMKLIGTR